MSQANRSRPAVVATQQLRADAAKILFQILEHGQSARECLPVMQQDYSQKDKAWLQEMVYGVLRQLPILQLWLRELLDKPLKNKNKVVEHLILLGFYQLAFSRVSVHAAVSETVAATRQLNAAPLKGLVNALLRNFIRRDLANQPITNRQVSSGLPKWLFKRIDSHYPEQISDICAAMQQRPPLWLRVNQQQVSREQYLQQLSEQQIEYTLSEQHPDGLVLVSGQDITTLPGFEQGWFAVQDGAAQLAAHYLQPQPQERILDCCAAPGGKTCHILELQPQLKQCVALDVDSQRLTRVEENLQRLGHQATLLCADAAATQSWWDGHYYDRILLDAPCSATGVIRRHPDIKWLRKNADIDALVALQYQILCAMWEVLKPGGMLLYATCSILPQENQQQIASFLARTANASLLPIGEHETPERPGRQILPGEKQMDGFYYARLLKS